MKVSKKDRKDTILELIVYFFCVGFVIIFWRNNLSVFALLLLLWLFALKFWHTREDIILFLYGGLVGIISEIACIYFGVWKYTNPSFFGVPIWLFLVWGLTVVSINRAARVIHHLMKK